MCVRNLIGPKPSGLVPCKHNYSDSSTSLREREQAKSEFLTPKRIDGY